MLDFGARRSDQFFNGDLQCHRSLAQYRKGRVGSTRLQARPGGPWNSGQLRHALLGQSVGLTESSDIVCQVCLLLIHSHENNYLLLK
jgi:hypothetical protein